MPYPPPPGPLNIPSPPHTHAHAEKAPKTTSSSPKPKPTRLQRLMAPTKLLKKTSPVPPVLTPTNRPPHFFPFTGTGTQPFLPLGQPLPLPLSDPMEKGSKPLPQEPGLAYPLENTFGTAYEREEGGLGLGGMQGGGGGGEGDRLIRGLSGESEVNPEYTPR